MINANRQFFYINSSNRLSGTNENFLYQILLPPLNDYTHVCVKRMVIPKSYYLIQAGFNTFTLTENKVNTLITITPGNYNASSFQPYLSNLLSTSSPNSWTYTVSYPSSTSSADIGKFNYTVSGNSSQPSLTFTTNVYEQFGFNANSTNTFVGNALQSANVLKFQVEDTLFIHSDICQNGIDNILQNVNASSGPPFSNILFEAPETLSGAKRLTSNANNVYNFSLQDENGNLLGLNGLNMQITIVVFKYEEVYKTIAEYVKYLLLKDESISR